MKLLLKWASVALFTLLLYSNELMAQKEISLFEDFEESTLNINSDERQIIPQIYRTVSVDFENLKFHLNQVPASGEATSSNENVYLELPMPDGTTQLFNIVKAPVLHPDLGERFPDIQSFAGQGIEDPSAYIRFDFTQKGFHAMIMSGKQNTVFIDPYSTADAQHYVSYFKNDYQKQDAEPFYCGVEGGNVLEGIEEMEADASAKTMLVGDCVMRKYRLALACTGEYAQYHGGSIPSVLAAMNTSMTRVVGVYEREVAITMEIIPNNDQLIFLNGATDPYTNNDGGTMLGQNQNTVDDIIGTANYDIGHVFSTGGGGIAQLNSPCSSSSKARGVTGLSNPIGDWFDVDYVCHEMGHQFGGNHTQNNSCQRNSSTAMEPGSASTIMGYAGICAPNVQQNSDDYFHVVSLREIAQNVTFGTSSTCFEEIPAINTAPTADAGLDRTIPIGTPFDLTGVATDAEDAGALTSTWEQMDNQVATMPPSGQSSGGPLFRSVDLTASPIRTFPRMQAVVNNQTPEWEVLPQVARTMNFTFSVRDNHLLHGCTADDDMVVTVSDAGGPFLVTQPNTTGISYEVNETAEITWDVAGTDQSPINCSFVNIKLSVDGGYTYPYLLAYQQPNSGSAMVTIPNSITNQARIRVEAFGNLFFDISNKNFAIVPATVPGFTLDVGPVIQDVCLPAEVTIDFESDSLLGFNNEVHFSLVSGLSDELAVYDQNPIIPGDAGAITLNLDNSLASGTYEVVLQAVAEGVDTVYRSVILNLTRNNFDDLEMQLPEDGDNSIILTSDFTWNGVPDAMTYDFELSTGPLFGDSTFVTEYGLTDTTFTPTDFFEENSLLFWRIRPVNVCGEGEWLDPFVFQTITAACETYDATDLPINISGSGTPTIESVINVETAGIISDVNIPYMKAVFQPVNSLRITLVSPAGTEVILYDQNCFNTQDLRIGFDDNSPFEITCPPDDAIVFRPIEQLSAFAGENTQGEWTMRVKVVESGFGASGALEQWNIEFCSSSATESPFVVNNDTLFVPPSGFNYISESELKSEDPDNDNLYELQYTILNPPGEGTIYYIDEPLGTGDVFRQTGINAYNISYVHDGGEALTDDFTFIVRDAQGGLSPIHTFNIVIDEDATVDTENLLLDQQVNVYPNPAKNTLYVDFDETVEGVVHLSLMNVQGQLITQSTDASTKQQILDINNVPSGMYFLNIRTELGNLTRKVIVE